MASDESLESCHSLKVIKSNEVQKRKNPVKRKAGTNELTNTNKQKKRKSFKSKSRNETHIAITTTAA